MPTRAIHLVTTTYMTWLPGDDRRHWSPLFDLYGHLLEKGHRLSIPDPTSRHHAAQLATDLPKVLSKEEIHVLAKTLESLLTTPYSPPLVAGQRSTIYKPPVVYAAAIEPTHVHLLIGLLKEEVATFIGRIKGITASALCALPENTGREHIWTTGYWEVFSSTTKLS